MMLTDTTRPQKKVGEARRHHRQIALDAGLSASKRNIMLKQSVVMATVTGPGGPVGPPCVRYRDCHQLFEIQGNQGENPNLRHRHTPSPSKTPRSRLLADFPFTGRVGQTRHPSSRNLVIKHLQTDGDYAHITILQLNVLVHHVEISLSVESLITPGLFLGGQYAAGTVHRRNKKPEINKLALLMREDHRHDVYDCNYGNKFLGFSSGHVWIHRTSTAHTPLGAGNRQLPVPDRP
jgi:hypothetical protein